MREILSDSTISSLFSLLSFFSLPLLSFIITLSLYPFLKLRLKAKETILWPLAKLLSLLFFASLVHYLGIAFVLLFNVSSFNVTLGFFLIVLFFFLSFFSVFHFIKKKDARKNQDKKEGSQLKEQIRKKIYRSIVKDIFVAIFKKNILCINKKSIVISELSFFLVYALFTLYSAYHPELFIGEKTLDMSFLSYFTEVDSYPFIDPWASGVAIKYYYFSYFLFGLLAKMTATLPSIAYILTISILPALFMQILVSLFSLINLSDKWAYFLSLMLLFSANLQSFLNFFSESKDSFSLFWKATRVFEHHLFAEFPSWSFIFMDLHPHVMAYPFAIASLVLTLLFVRRDRVNVIEVNLRNAVKKIEKNLEKNIEDCERKKIYFFLIPFLLSCLLLMNAWDFIIYTPLCALLIFANSSFKALFKIFTLMGLIGGILTLFPYFVLKGGAPLFLKMRPDFFEEWWGYFLHLGFFIFFILLFLLFFLYDKCLKKGQKDKEFFSLTPSHLENSQKTCFSFIFILILYSLFLILFSNSVHFMDHFNTVFKFNNQSYILFGIAASFGLFYLWEKKRIFSFFCFPVIICSLLASFYNAKLFLDIARKSPLKPTLDTSYYLKERFPDVFAGLNFAREHLLKKRGPILELSAEPFDFSMAHLSTYLGLNSYFARKGHAISLRGVVAQEALRRERVANAIYSAKDSFYAYQLLKSEMIRYVWIGQHERSRFSLEELSHFEDKKYFDKIFSFEDKKAFIYEVL